MRGLYVKLLLIALGFALILAIPGLLDRVRTEPRNERIKKRFSRELASDVSVRRHGVYGVDFVRCGNCRIEKRKLGGLSLGCFNVLVLENLAVVIPPREKTGQMGEKASDREISAKELSEELGIGKDFLKANGCGLRFSGLRIVNLSVATLDALSNAVPRFVAESGVAKSDGLHLSGCGIIQDSQTNCVGRAVLKPKPILRLEWSGGDLKLQ